MVPPIPEVAPQPIPPAPTVMNWSYSEAYKLRTTDWIDTYNFAMGQRVQRFPLAPASKTRLCYQSMHSFQGSWEE